MSSSLVTTLIRRLLLVGGLLTLLNIVFVTVYYSSDPEGLRREKVNHQIDRLAEALQRGRMVRSPSIPRRACNRPSPASPKLCLPHRGQGRARAG